MERDRRRKRVCFMRRVAAVALALCLAVGALPGLSLTAQAAGDDYPYKNACNGCHGDDVDPWNFYYRQCTSFAAWRLNSANGAKFSNWYLGVRWGHAKNWGAAARSVGITVDKTPRVGSVWWSSAGTYGHVAWVKEVSGANVTIEEYNYVNATRYGTRTLPASSATGYIHIKDIQQPDPEPPFDRLKGAYMTTGYARTIPDGYYHIASSLGDQWWLTIAGMSNDNGANVNLWDYSIRNFECDEQVFYFKFIDEGGGKGFYKITSKKSGKCLDVVNGSIYMYEGPGKPTNVQQYADDGTAAQRWAIREIDGGEKGVVYALQARCSGFNLDLFLEKTENGANISMHSGNGGSAAQQWRLVPFAPSIGKTLADGEYQIVSKLDNNKALGFNESQNQPGTDVKLDSSFKGSPKQTFQVSYLGDGYYSIINKDSGLSLDVPNFSRKMGTNVKFHTNNGSDAQKWIIKDAGGGYYNIVSKCSAQNLSIPGTMVNGTSVCMWPWHGGNDQQWKFVPYKPAVEVSALTLNKTVLTLKAGETSALEATVSPANAADKTIAWESSDEKVATVNKDGLVTAKAKGNAKITAKSTNGKTASCQVTVEEVHVHAYEGEWQSDAGKHWKICVCGEKGQEAAHAFASQSEGSVKREICSVCGYVGKTIGGDEIPDTGFWAAPLDPQTYTGSAVKPELDVYFDGELLTERQDYSVSYQNNINACKASDSSAPTVIVTGKGKNKGKLALYFEIAPKDISAGDVTASRLSASFDGRKKNPTPILSYRGKKLRAGKDYTIDYDECRAPGSYQVLIQGRGNYEGEKTLTFTVSGDRPASKMTVARISAQSYQGSEVEPKPVVKDGGDRLTEGKEYTLSYRSNVKVGTASLIITGIPSGGYTGTKTVTYKIKPCSVKSAQIKVELEASYPLTPNGCKPEPVVTFQGKTLVKGEDYTLSYRNNKKASSMTSGKKAPTVVIKGRGNFGGSCERTFVITK